MQSKLILASTSPRRKILLKQISQRFLIMAPDYDEGRPKGDPVIFVKKSALGKAQSIAKKCRPDRGWVLAADTLVVLGDQIFGKARNKKDARRMIQLLAGRRHQVLTGMVLYDLKTGGNINWVEKTNVYMRSISDAELETYLQSEAWQGKAGAYGIQDQAAAFITKISGCYFNVVGLPLARLAKELHQRGLR